MRPYDDGAEPGGWVPDGQVPGGQVPEGEVAGVLMAIDAALAGEPGDPEHAGLAELALILRADRPRPDPGFARALDERVQRRFAAPPRAAGGAAGWRRRLAPAAWGAGALAAGAVVAIAVVLGGARVGGSPAPSSSAASSSVASPAGAEATRSGARAAPSGTASGRAAASAPGHAPASAPGQAPASGTGAGSAAPPSSTGPPVPVPSTARRIVQSAQLQLSTTPGRIDDVAQEVFDVVASVNGIVDSSSVTSGGGSPAPATGPVVAPAAPGGGAFFQLRVPSVNLSQALSALSRLRYADVVSRTDATQDITGQVGRAGMRLAEARALRRSLLGRLAAATTTEQVDSLRLQLRDVDASIASRLATLDGLRRQVAYSRISLTVDAATPPPGPVRGAGFTLGRAARDAGRVLVVVAGVGLIALAALIPVALLAALGVWVGLGVRRRRRERALDAA